MNVVDELSLSLAQAAQLMGFDSATLNRLVRLHDIATVEGRRAKGGQLRLSFRDLPAVEAAVKLADLGVPRPSIRELTLRAVQSMREHPDANILLSHRGKALDDVVVGPDDEAIRRIIEVGVAAVLIRSERRRELVDRLASQVPVPRRGRPRLDPAYVARKLESSEGLGADVADPAAEIRRLSGE